MMADPLQENMMKRNRWSFYPNTFVPNLLIFRPARVHHVVLDLRSGLVVFVKSRFRRQRRRRRPGPRGDG